MVTCKIEQTTRVISHANKQAKCQLIVWNSIEGIVSSHQQFHVFQ